MKKKNFVLLMIFVFIMISGCSKKENPEVLESQIYSDLKQLLLKDDIEFDSISELDYKEESISEDDLKILKSKFSSEIVYKKLNCKFNAVSIKMNIQIEYSCIYVYNGGEWYLSFGYPINEEKWEYTAKQNVGLKKIMNDLKSIKFDGFTDGYVGDAAYTTIEIKSRNEEKMLNKDDVELNVIVETDFAEFKIPVNLIYFFKDGNWILDGFTVLESDQWNMMFTSRREPKPYNEDYIISLLTINTNFLTYTTNIEYCSSYELKFIKKDINLESVIYSYDFVVQYDNIGFVVYDIKIEYFWLDGDWSEGNANVTIKNYDFSYLLNKKYVAENGSVISFENISTSNEISNDLLTGIFTLNEIDYDFEMKINVLLRDNEWDIIFTNKNNGDVSVGSYIDFNTKSIYYNEDYYYLIEESDN